MAARDPRQVLRVRSVSLTFSPRTARKIAWAMLGASLLLTAVGLVLFVAVLSRPDGHVFDYWLENLVLAVGWSTLGALIVHRRPDHATGWLLCLIGLVAGLDQLVAQYAILDSQLAANLSLAPTAAWVRTWIWVPHLAAFALFALLFPDGTVIGRWRHLGTALKVLVPLGSLWVAFSPGPVRGLGEVANPAGVAVLNWPGSRLAIDVVEIAMFVVIALCVASLVARLRHARGRVRKQLQWFVYVAVVSTLAVILTYGLTAVVDGSSVRTVSLSLLVLGLCAIPTCVTVAILKQRLFNIERLVSRTLVYASVMAAIAGIYVTIAVLPSLMFETHSELSVAASTLVAAATFRPLLLRVRFTVDRRFNRAHYDAERVLEDFGHRLRNELDASALCEALATSASATVRPRHASVWPMPDRVSCSAARVGSP